MAKCLTLQVSDGVAYQGCCHLGFAAWEVVVQRGFAQPGGTRKMRQRSAIVAAGDKYLP